MCERGDLGATREAPTVRELNWKPARDRSGPGGVADRLVVPREAG
jgi:hypothetical protein